MKCTFFKNIFSCNKKRPPIKTIEQEMAQARARYNQYLATTNDSFVAQRGDVKIKDPHTMAGDAYYELRDNIDSISQAAKKANKEVTFEDARVLTRDNEVDSPTLEDCLSSKILVTVKDKLTKKSADRLIDRFTEPEVPFMKKVSNVLGELFTGKTGANLDSEIPIK